MPVKAAKKQPQPPQEAEEQTSGGESMNRASAFDSQRAAGSVAPGKYEAIVAELVLQPEDEKGQSARVKYEIASPGEMRGEQVTQWYKLFDENGAVAKGAAFLKKDLAVMGYPDVSFADLETVFESIVEKDTPVLIQVKQNGTFTNCYLQGLCEDSDIISEYLENRTF